MLSVHPSPSLPQEAEGDEGSLRDESSQKHWHEKVDQLRGDDGGKATQTSAQKRRDNRDQRPVSAILNIRSFPLCITLCASWTCASVLASCTCRARALPQLLVSAAATDTDTCKPLASPALVYLTIQLQMCTDVSHLPGCFIIFIMCYLTVDLETMAVESIKA